MKNRIISKKKREIKEALHGDLLSTAPFDNVSVNDLNIVINDIIEKGLEIVPPEELFTHHYLKLPFHPKNDSKSYTVKPGNIILNIKLLLEMVSSGVFVAAGSMVQPWLIPFGIILICSYIWKTMKLDLTVKDSIVILAIWNCQIEGKEGTEEAIFERANIYLIDNHMDLISKRQFGLSLDNLMTLGCIYNINGAWKVREYITFSFN